MAKRKENKWIRRVDGVIEMRLTQGKIALLDECDLEKVLPYKWLAHYERGRWYVYARSYDGPGRYNIVRMHRIIMEPPDDLDVDHINRDGLDNRRKNLRIATRSQNLANRPKRADAIHSQYKGVTINAGRWRAVILHQRIRHHLGYFDTEKEAALAYNEAALRLFGEFALLNTV